MRLAMTWRHSIWVREMTLFSESEMHLVVAVVSL